MRILPRSEGTIAGNGRMFLVDELWVARRVFPNRAAIVVRVAAIFRYSRSTYIVIHAIPLDTTTLNRSSAFSPLRKTAGAMPILADGKSA